MPCEFILSPVVDVKVHTRKIQAKMYPHMYNRHTKQTHHCWKAYAASELCLLRNTPSSADIQFAEIIQSVVPR